MVLLIAGVVLLITLGLAVLTIVLRKSISKLAMVVGLAPLPLLLAALVIGKLVARYNASEVAPPPDRKPTAPAVALPVVPD